jgi:UrcA family protein
MKLTQNSRIAAGLIAASLVLAPSAAIAAETGPAPQIQVKYSDLNLASADGVAELERRIERAAKKVCGASRLPTGSRIADIDARQCVAKAKASAAQSFAAALEQQRRGG